MTREELLKSPEYHLAGLQVSVYNMLEREKEHKEPYQPPISKTA